MELRLKEPHSAKLPAHSPGCESHLNTLLTEIPPAKADRYASLPRAPSGLQQNTADFRTAEKAWR